MKPEPKKMHALLASARAALLAFPAEKLLRPRVPRERATQLTAILRREFEPLLPRLPNELSKARVAERKADFDGLEPNALVFYAADLAVETPWTSDQKARRGELVTRVHQHDQTLSGWAVLVFKGNPEISAIVADILRGRGIRDDADDTLRLVALFRKHWAAVKGKTAITEQDLDQAEDEATELLQVLDAPDVGTTGSPRDLRQRAYTVWVRSYAEIFHLGRYLLRDDPEAARRFPAVSAERGEAEAPEPEEGGGAPPPPAAPT